MFFKEPDIKFFYDRAEAGKLLAKKMSAYEGKDMHILALARGGVEIGYYLSRCLRFALDVFVVRKIGSPYDPEFGIGAIAEGNTLILKNETIDQIGLSQQEVKQLVKKEKSELKRRVATYRKKDIKSLKGMTVIIADDGVATGITAIAAIKAIKKKKPRKIIFAAPVSSYDTAEVICSYVDETYFLYTPRNMKAVGLYYVVFDQVGDKDVLSFLRRAYKD